MVFAHFLPLQHPIAGRGNPDPIDFFFFQSLTSSLEIHLPVTVTDTKHAVTCTVACRIVVAYYYYNCTLVHVHNNYLNLHMCPQSEEKTMAVTVLLYFLLTVKSLGIKPDESCCVITIMNKSLEIKKE